MAKNKKRNKKQAERTRKNRVPYTVQIYIGFVAAGILIVAGMLYMKGRYDLPVAAAEALPVQARVLFGGDMMFDRTIRTTAQVKGGDYIFACLDPLLKEQDLVVANLEGPITDNTSISQFSEMGDGNNFTFTFPPATAPLLYAHNIRLVNLGNNHIFNFHLAGVRDTERYLDEANVGHFGDPDKTESEKVARLEIKGIKFSFINWSDWTSDNTDITAAQVKMEHDAGRIVVVYTHWGEEYLPATAREKRLAHDFIDQGADIVFGSHPHVVQEHEIYKGKHIYYSLGNLIFDQYFDESVTRGLTVEVQFGKNGVAGVKEIPVTLERTRQTCPPE